MMSSTPHSLLARLRREADPQTWERFVGLYAPLIRGWLGRYQLQAADADDLVQDVLSVVVRDLVEFQHSGRTGAFRTWLRLITVHRIRNFWRSNRRRTAGTLSEAQLEELAQLEDSGSDLSKAWDEAHDRQVVERLLEMIERDFQPSTWKAFRRLMLDGASAAEVGAELGISANAAWIAKSRVLHRLRQEMEGLVD